MSIQALTRPLVRREWNLFSIPWFQIQSTIIFAVFIEVDRGIGLVQPRNVEIVLLCRCFRLDGTLDSRTGEYPELVFVSDMGYCYLRFPNHSVLSHGRADIHLPDRKPSSRFRRCSRQGLIRCVQRGLRQVIYAAPSVLPATAIGLFLMVSKKETHFYFLFKLPGCYYSSTDEITKTPRGHLSSAAKKEKKGKEKVCLSGLFRCQRLPPPTKREFFFFFIPVYGKDNLGHRKLLTSWKCFPPVELELDPPSRQGHTHQETVRDPSRQFCCLVISPQPGL